MPKQPPADELAETLAELDRLTQRADRLRALIVQNPDRCATGLHARALVVQQTDRVFDPALLPAEIRDDPRYFREDLRAFVLCQPLGRTAHARPGWPIRRDVGAAMH